jgi:transcriptional regulator with GAF, ATPase, and Fis domain
VPIVVPPLRERQGDVPLLAHLFADRYARQFGKRIDGISNATMARLAAYPWPGNVRELQNVIERAVVLAQGPILEFGGELLPAAGAAAASPVLAVPPAAADSPGPNGHKTLDDVSRSHIVDTLIAANWVIDGPRGAAAVLRVNPSTLRSRMKKLGIRRSSDVSGAR